MEFHAGLVKVLTIGAWKRRRQPQTYPGVCIPNCMWAAVGCWSSIDFFRSAPAALANAPPGNDLDR